MPSSQTKKNEVDFYVLTKKEFQGMFPVQKARSRNYLYVHIYVCFYVCVCVYVCVWWLDLCVHTFSSLRFYHTCRFVYLAPQSKYWTVPLPQGSLLPFCNHTHLHPLSPTIPNPWQPLICCWKKMLFKWNRVICNILSLTFFTRHNSLEIYPSCVYQ